MSKISDIDEREITRLEQMVERRKAKLVAAEEKLRGARERAKRRGS